MARRLDAMIPWVRPARPSACASSCWRPASRPRPGGGCGAWVRRVERLLDGQPETPIHGALAVAQTYRLLWSGEVDAALGWARRAIELGNRFSDPATIAFGRVGEARALILQGHVEEGLLLLDEAAVAAVAGDLDPFAAASVYCSVVCGFQGVADYERAEEWTQAMERWRSRHGVGGAHGRCRIHRAEILRLRGAWREAEEEARLACEESRPYLRGEAGWPLAELGQIRLRLGNLAGARAGLRGVLRAGMGSPTRICVAPAGPG